MTARTLRALWRERHRIDVAFRRDSANRSRFMQMFREPQGLTHELRRMNLFGILGEYLPAFGRIVGQMQHDLFHVYTVDEHILMVIRNLRRFTEAQHGHEYPLCSRLITDFEHKEVLYLAGLFHDIAKGRGGDHSAEGARDATRFCLQHGLPKADADLVAWLVEHHLTMSSTAQKQDITNPEVVRAFAAQIGTERRLIALYLLTVADIRGTSPKVWNAWKAKLLEDLFHLTRRLLDPGQVPDFIALRGDPSDKLPGARGVGPKTAASILGEYGTLEGALEAGRFSAEAEDLRLYRRMAQLDASAPLPSLADQTPKWAEASSLSESWGLGNLAGRLAALAE